MRLAQGCSQPREIVCIDPVLTNAYGPLKSGEGVVQVTLAEGQLTNSIRSNHESRGVRNRLGNPQPLLPESPTLSERTQLGMTPGEVGTVVHRREVDPTEALTVLRSAE